MSTINLLYQKEYSINDKISIVIPTVGEILKCEDEYYSMVSSLTSMPIDMMVQLDDMGLDFTKISEYELFIMMFIALKNLDTGLIFKDLDLTKFELGVNEQNGNSVLIDIENDIVIDRAIQEKIAACLRRIHNLEKNNRKAGNDEAKEFLLERARKKQKHAKRKQESQLESLIIAMVNTEQFKYNYESVLNLTIYQFNESVHQIIKKVAYDNRMFGVYSGTVNAKELSQDELNWLVHK